MKKKSVKKEKNKEKDRKRIQRLRESYLKDLKEKEKKASTSISKESEETKSPTCNFLD